jgi:hypothetical protein
VVLATPGGAALSLRGWGTVRVPSLAFDRKPSLTCGNASGRYWVRTSDLFGVNEARYHCANRPDTLRVRRQTLAYAADTACQAMNLDPI